MLGHFHDGRGDEFLRYPGSPEPLDWGERNGDHGVSSSRWSRRRDRRAGRDRHPPLRRARRSSVAGAAGSAQVEAAVLAAAAAEPGASLRVVLTGEIEPGCEISPAQPRRALRRGPDELAVVDQTVPAYDLDAVAREESVRGRFVARLLHSAEPEAHEAILAGLRALDGRKDVIGAG